MIYLYLACLLIVYLITSMLFFFVNMPWQRSFWFCVLLTKQLKWDNAGHREVTINNAATVGSLQTQSLLLFFLLMHRPDSHLR